MKTVVLYNAPTHILETLSKVEKLTVVNTNKPYRVNYLREKYSADAVLLFGWNKSLLEIPQEVVLFPKRMDTIVGGTPESWKLLRKHSQISRDMLRNSVFYSDLDDIVSWKQHNLKSSFGTWVIKLLEYQFSDKKYKVSIEELQNNSKMITSLTAGSKYSIEPFIDGKTITVLIIKDKSFIFRQTGEYWVRDEFLYEQVENPEAYDALRTDALHLGAEAGLEVFSIDYQVSHEGVVLPVDLNYIPGLSSILTEKYMTDEVRQAVAGYVSDIFSSVSGN